MHRLPVFVLLGLVAVGIAGCAEKPPSAPSAEAALPPAPDPLPPTQSAAMCVKPAEHSAFDVSTLRNFLVVMAITCKQEDRYNAIVNRFQTDLSASEKTLDGYFARAYGRKGRSTEDDYNTQLVSAQSQYSSRSGNLFCQQQAALWDQVMALGSGSDLAQFAASKPLQRVLAVQDCSAAAAAPTTKVTAKKKS